MSGHRRYGRISGLAVVLSALAIGTAGHFGAKALIVAKLAHMHAAAPGTSVEVAHVHDPAAAFAVLAGCLTLISVLTAAVVVIGNLAASSGPSCTAVRWASGLSIWTFILGNVVSYAAAGTSATHPALLLAVGGAVQVVVGGVAGLLWWQWIETTLEQDVLPVVASERAKPAVVAVSRPAARMRRRWWAAPASGRAPPLLRLA